MYSPAAIFERNKLEVLTELTDGGVVYLLDFGDEEIYIGSTTNFVSRLNNHISRLRISKHTPLLQKAFDINKSFNAYVLLYLSTYDEDVLREAEKSMIRLIRPSLNLQIPTHSSLSITSDWRKAIKSIKEQDNDNEPMIGFVYFKGKSYVPRTMSQVMDILEDMDKSKFTTLCMRENFKQLRRIHADNQQIMSTIDLLESALQKYEPNKLNTQS